VNIIDLDGNEMCWKPRGRPDTNTRKSSLHLKTRSVLKTKFPTIRILEEVTIPIKKGKKQYLDFYIPLKQLAIEVHGEQHFAMSSMFHKTKADFIKQKRNDREKEEWCDINGIRLIIFRYDQEGQWEDLL
jgi:hypothetical protein